MHILFLPPSSLQYRRTDDYGTRPAVRAAAAIDAEQGASDAEMRCYLRVDRWVVIPLNDLIII
jgi:hypothetical protein